MINITIKNTKVQSPVAAIMFSDVSVETSKKVLDLLLEDLELETKE